MERGISSSRLWTVVGIVVVLAAVSLYLAAFAGGSSSTSTSSTTSQSTIQGIIAGTVTVGPSQATCSANQACTEDLTGYSLVFTSQCGTAGMASSTTCERQNFTAAIAPSGHYSILLAPGDYSITGMSPSCSWVGCSTTFPKAVTVLAGQQIIVNVDVDTGIR